MIKLSVKLIVVLILISSCSSKFSLQKRKYNKGFYFAHNSNQNKTSTTNSKPNKNIAQTNEVIADNEIMAQNSELSATNYVSDPIKHTYNSATNSFTKKNYTKKTQPKTNNKTESETALIKIKSKNNHQKKYIGKKNDAFDLINNIYIGYIIVSFVITCIVVAFFLFQAFPPLEAIAIIIIGVLVLAALAGIGAWANSGGW